mgnify:CR=1 FL=1
MKTCQKCKTQNADNARYCSVCNVPFGAMGTNTCPKGHTVDPTWTECPFCKGQGAPARKMTEVESPASAPAAVRPVPPPPPPPVVGAPVRRMTEFAPPPQSGGTVVETPAPRVTQRKIVGVLITYSWRPDGQMFPVREGRNLIGRGAECEIQVPEDGTLSSVNTHITFRKSFTVGDMVSMSGTDINGTPIEEQFVTLESGAKLRTGSTNWTFLAIPSAE